MESNYSTKHIALLRGINVGGNRKVPMTELRTLLESSGLESVETYIQSGNIIFQSAENSDVLEELIGKAIEKHFEFSVSVIVKSTDEWEYVIKQNPFSSYESAELYLKKLGVTFLKSPLSPEDRKKLDAKKTKTEDYVLEKNILYGWYGEGFGKSKMAEIISKIPDGTTRNWNTVLKIQELISN